MFGIVPRTDRHFDHCLGRIWAWHIAGNWLGLGKGIRDFKKSMDGAEEEMKKIVTRSVTLGISVESLVAVRGKEFDTCQ